MINCKVRFKNVQFWLAAIPALLLLIQAVAALFGFQLDLTGVKENLLNVANTLFAFLAILGVVNDPTTRGIGDSDRALTYDKPN